MIFIEPTKEYLTQIKEYKDEFLKSGDSMDGTGALRRFDDPKEWLEYVTRNKNPKTVDAGLVPATQYIFVDDEKEKIVGMLQIRHCLNDYLKNYGGHIGYSVAPGERRKGYATKMLGLALEKCREMGIDKVLVTCISGNLGSKGAILNNGGVYENTLFEPDEGIDLERYWINLQNTPFETTVTDE